MSYLGLCGIGGGGWSLGFINNLDMNPFFALSLIAEFDLERAFLWLLKLTLLLLLLLLGGMIRELGSIFK